MFHGLGQKGCVGVGLVVSKVGFHYMAWGNDRLNINLQIFFEVRKTEILNFLAEV